MTVKGNSELLVSSAVTCGRCNTSTAIMSIRNDRDRVCEKCFLNYVTTKAVKRMESYKFCAVVAKAPQKLMLPISFGLSSTSLLFILDNHLRGQLNRMGRTTYSLLIVSVDLEADVAQKPATSALLERFQSRFPNHEYLIADLSQAIALNIDWGKLGMKVPTKGVPPVSDKSQLDSLSSLVSSPTSKADIASTLLTRLLVDIAKKNDCEGILFGDSTTRLAEKTLIETAKGRGFSLPWQVSDGISPDGVKFLYPLRELLKRELLDFSSLTSPTLADLIIYQASAARVSASAKSTTIDDLMAQYFETVEEKFPAVVANVVRTASKLQAQVSSQSSACCELCALPVAEGTNGIYGWGGDQSSDEHPIQEGQSGGTLLCYGCSRSINC